MALRARERAHAPGAPMDSRDPLAMNEREIRDRRHDVMRWVMERRLTDSTLERSCEFAKTAADLLYPLPKEGVEISDTIEYTDDDNPIYVTRDMFRRHSQQILDAGMNRTVCITEGDGDDWRVVMTLTRRVPPLED